MGQIKYAERLAYDLIDDIVIASVKAGAAKACDRLVSRRREIFSAIHSAKREEFVLLKGQIQSQIKFHIFIAQQDTAQPYLQTPITHSAQIRQ